MVRRLLAGGLGRAIVILGIAMIAACWRWAARMLRLPTEERVFDR